jgi:PKD repeat protein
MVFADGDSIRTVRVWARDIHKDAAAKVKFIYKTDPCDGPIPPIGGGSFSGKIPFDLRHNDPITFTFDPTPGFKEYEAYCKETIDLNVVNETRGGVLPLVYSWPTNPVPPVETYSHTVNNSPDLVKVTVSDGCNNQTDATVKIVNKPIQLQTIPTLSFCAPGMSQEVEAHWMPANDFPGYDFVSNLCNWNNITDTPPTLLGTGNPFTIVYDNDYVEQIWQAKYNVTDVCGNNASGTFNVDQTGKLDIGDDKYICEGESVELITFTPSLNDDPMNYVWYKETVSPPNKIGNGPSITVIPGDTTQYILYILDKCNEVQYDSLIVFVDHFLPEITISPASAEVCPGEVVTFTANDANVWEWTPGGETTQSITRTETVPGVYTYTLTASSDYCIDKQVSASYEVFPQPSPAFSFMPDEEACTGEDIQFTYGDDAVGKEFDWDFGDGGTSTIPNPVHAYVNPNTYTVYLHVQQYICDDDTSMTVLVNPLPAPDFTADVFEGCLPVDVQFTDKSQDVFPGAIYEWNLGDGTSSGVQNPAHTYNTAGLFSVSLKISNTERCFASISKPNLIQANPNPIADFEADPWITTMDRPDIDFSNLSIADSAWYDFLWDFGDGSTSGDENPSHTYTDAGDYYISLRVETINGCWDTTLEMVALTEEVKLFIPNAFTPNGDGVNDVFEIKGTPIMDFNLYIYDRWGGELWSTHDFGTQWDGNDRS